MINAERARQITNQAIGERESRKRAMIKSEVRTICNEICPAAYGGHEGYKVSAIGFSYPAEVAKHLCDELGYNAEYDHVAETIEVSW